MGRLDFSKVSSQLNTLVVAVLAALFGLAFASGSALAAPVAPSCHSYTDRVQGAGGLALPRGAQWICSQSEFDSSRRVVWIRFGTKDLAAAHDATHFVTRVTRFDRLSLFVQRGGSLATSRNYTMDEIGQLVNGPRFAVPLPDLDGAEALIVAIDRPWNAAIASEALLQSSAGSAITGLGWSAQAMLAVAVLCGLLLAPLLYDIAFYAVLRQKFILWHMVMVVGMLGYLLVSSGLLHYLAKPHLALLAFLSPFSFLVAIAAGAPFTAHYLEPSALSPFMRRLVVWAGVATFLVVGILCLPIEGLRPISNDGYYLGFLPSVIVFVIAMAQAALRGSRAVWFQIIGWTPLVITGLERVPRGMGFYSAPAWVDQLIYGALALEIAFTATGVVDRFNVLRRERDKANARLDMLSSLVDRDALTGIYNRRALETRFAELRADGFTAMAVLDLDHFKRVNDEFGHSTGDRVLQEVAAVLRSDADALAFRVGGEEFVLLMRGQQVQQRAEQIRNAIPIRIANQVTGLPLQITASMGVVESPPGAATTMRRLYAHADRLLYEAKNSGRNRLISERVQLFDAPLPEISDRRIGPVAGRRGCDAHL